MRLSPVEVFAQLNTLHETWVCNIVIRSYHVVSVRMITEATDRGPIREEPKV